MLRFTLAVLLAAALSSVVPAHADSPCAITRQSDSLTCSYTTDGRSVVVSEITQNSAWRATVVRNGVTTVVAGIAAPNNGLPACVPVVAHPGEVVTITYIPGGVLPFGVIYADDANEAC